MNNSKGRESWPWFTAHPYPELSPAPSLRLSRRTHSTSNAPEILSSCYPQLSSLDHSTTLTLNFSFSSLERRSVPFLFIPPPRSPPFGNGFLQYKSVRARFTTTTHLIASGEIISKFPPVFLSCELLVEAFFFICIYLILSHSVSPRALSYPVVRTQFCAPEGD